MVVDCIAYSVILIIEQNCNQIVCVTLQREVFAEEMNACMLPSIPYQLFFVCNIICYR